jgi:hypothetical protein
MIRSFALFILLSACVESRKVGVNFGESGEGLDGFLCKDSAGQMLLDRLAQPDGGVVRASIVTDFVRLGGVPGCRTGQLVQWCAAHSCAPISTTRVCTSIELPTKIASMKREEMRAAVREKMNSLTGKSISSDAPNEFVILRVMATAQPCSELAVSGRALPEYDRTQLVGCAYSCPTLFDQVDQDVYLGFETLTAQCEQGVRICADNDLHWQP